MTRDDERLACVPGSCPVCGGDAGACPIEERTYYLENLGCANCAAKMEHQICELPRMQDASLSFATKRLHIACPHPDEALPQIQQICQGIEPEVRVVDAHGHRPEPRGEACSCCDGEDHHGHHHDHRHDAHRGEAAQAPGSDAHAAAGWFGFDTPEARRDLLQIAVAAVLLALGLAAEHAGWPAYVHVVLFAAAYLAVGFDILATAVRNIRAGNVFDENLLMSVASLGAFALGEYPEAVGVMMFYRVGELLEDRAVQRSRDQIRDAVDMRPETVNLVVSYAETAGTDQPTKQVAAERVAIGDYVLVRPGERIPVDGTVVQGSSRLDTSSVTGEPVPRAVEPGSPVVSGCVNTHGVLVMRADAPLSESMVTRILDAVENAADSKPQLERFITKFARVYTPVVIAIAALTAIVPSLVVGDPGHWIYIACTFLVISCPCAIVLSVPLSFFAGIGAAGKEGILFKGGTSIEALATVDTVALDKTGTVTQGTFAVRSVEPCASFTQRELLYLAASCEAHSTHPIATSILDQARERGIAPSTPSRIDEHAGQGIHAQLGAGEQALDVLCGNAKLMDSFGVAVPGQEAGGPQDSLAGTTVVLLAVDGAYAGALHIADEPKPDAAAAIEAMTRQGLHTVMLTGDVRGAAQAVGREVGIDDVRAELLPENKVAELKKVRAEHGSVMFVGDGINDAPVLAGADVGAAFASGTDAALQAADVVLMRPELEGVVKSRAIACAVRRVATQNIVFALAVKLAVMVLGFAGIASMWAAVFADVGVALLCILNSVRLLRMRF